MAGTDVLVGVGVDTGGDPQPAREPVPAGGADLLQPLQLVETVDHHPAHSLPRRLRQLVLRLVAAVEHDALHGYRGHGCRMQLAARRHVDPEALLHCELHQPHHRPGLGGVGDLGAREGAPIGAAAAANVVFVDDPERRPVPLRQLGDGDAAHLEQGTAFDDGRAGPR